MKFDIDKIFLGLSCLIKLDYSLLYFHSYTGISSATTRGLVSSTDSVPRSPLSMYLCVEVDGFTISSPFQQLSLSSVETPPSSRAIGTSIYVTMPSFVIVAFG